jgi:anti-sigma B factor antagonist
MSSFYFISDETTPEDVGIIAMGGEIDYAASPELRERVFDHIKAGRRGLVIDLTDATFIDSTAIGVLVGAVARLREHDGTLAIVCPDARPSQGVVWPRDTNRIRQIIRITGLDAGVRLCDSRDEALFECAMVG